MAKHFNKSSEMANRRLLRQRQTFAEAILWMHLRNRKCLGIKFRRQYSVDKFVIDFYAPELKLAIELDGGIHNDPDVMAKDVDRQKYIETFGITFVRITNEEYLGNPEKAFEKIEAAIRELQKKTSPPPLSSERRGAGV